MLGTKFIAEIKKISGFSQITYDYYEPKTGLCLVYFTINNREFLFNESNAGFYISEKNENGVFSESHEAKINKETGLVSRQNKSLIPTDFDLDLITKEDIIKFLKLDYSTSSIIEIS